MVPDIMPYVFAIKLYLPIKIPVAVKLPQNKMEAISRPMVRDLE